MVNGQKIYMQKKSTILVLLIVINFMASAQFQKGQKVLGGNIGFTVGKSENGDNYTSRQNSFTINPSFAKFTKPNQLCGIGVGYGYSRQKFESPVTSQNTNVINQTIGVNVFSQRLYNMAKNLYFTLNTPASVYYMFGNNKIESSNSVNEIKNTGYSINLSLAPGLSYQLNNRWLFDAYLSNLVNIGFSHNQSKSSPSNNKTKSNNFGISSSLSNTNLGNIGLGFRYLLRN